MKTKLTTTRKPKRKPARRRAPIPFNWGREITKAIDERLKWTEGGSYTAVRATVCNMIAAVLDEITAGIDSAMDKALELEPHAPTFMLEKELTRRRGTPAPDDLPHAIALASTTRNGGPVEYHVEATRRLAQIFADRFNEGEANDKKPAGYVAIVTPNVPAAALAKFKAKQKRAAERTAKRKPRKATA